MSEHLIKEASAMAVHENSAFEGALAYAKAFIVSDDASYSRALEDVREVKARAKTLEHKAASLIDPLKGVIAAIKAEIDPTLRAAKEIERVLKDKCAAFKVALEHENERRRAEAQAALTERRALPEHVAALASTAPKLDGVTTRKVFKIRITDAGAVPQRYRVYYVDEKAILADVVAAEGKAPIPGVEIFEDYIIGVRA